MERAQLFTIIDDWMQQAELTEKDFVYMRVKGNCIVVIVDEPLEEFVVHALAVQIKPASLMVGGNIEGLVLTISF
jgi:hypothetical protein